MPDFLFFHNLSANVSYYAFTATPKPKTLELFGRTGADGTPQPFHVYSMRQAIEEEFILDVLKGYVTYEVALLLEQAADNKEVKSSEAKKKLFRFAQLHPTSIAQKVVVIAEHFREHVILLLGGQAKAMVVTDSRLSAVRYKKAFDAYVGCQKYTDCRALVTFSGKVADCRNDTEYPVTDADEGALNDHHEREDSTRQEAQRKRRLENHRNVFHVTNARNMDGGNARACNVMDCAFKAVSRD